MNRQLKLLEYALAGLTRRKGKNVALLLVYAFTIAALGSVLFLTDALRSEARQTLDHAPEMVVQRISAGRHELIPRSYATTIAQLPGVRQATPRVWGYYYDALVRANFTLMGVTEPETQIKDLQGQLPAADNECAVGIGIADIFGATIGDSLVLVDAHGKNRVFAISGIFSAHSALLTHDLILMPEPALRAFFNLDPTVATDIAVSIANPREITTLAKKVRYHLPDTRPISRSEILHTYDSIFNWRSGMMFAVSVAALIAFCILAWDKATGISADEKREIGILKAVGWNTGDVMAIKFWEGLILSLSAFLIGTIAAWLHVFVLGAPALTPILKGWSVLFPPFSLQPVTDPYQILVLAFLTIAPYLACTLIPAWKTAITAPEQAMRS